MHGANVVRALAALAVLALTGLPVIAQDLARETRQDEVTELRKRVEDQERLIRELLQRIEKLEAGGKPAAPAEEPPVPEVALPAPDAQTTAPARAGSYTPDIAVIGNNVGRFFSVKGDPDRNRLQLGEFELALQQPVYQGVQFFATVAGGAEEGFSISAEEAYVQFAHLGAPRLGGLLGRKRLNFGKLNPVHPHAWSFADAPAASLAFTGDHGLIGNGASLNYTLPVKGLFANLEVGYFKPSAHAHEHDEAEHTEEEALLVGRSRRLATRAAEEHHHEPGLGAASDFPMARLWLAKGGSGAEAELGVSHGFGKADNGDHVRLTGMDLTLRSFPGAFRRLQLQGEVFWHQRKDRAEGTGVHTRSGHYALLSWRPDQYDEWALRLDNTRYPWPIEGREQALSLIWARRLTEATILRLQLKHGDRTADVFLPARKRYSELYLQFIWGAGSHTHPLY